MWFLSWWRGSIRFVPTHITCNKAKTRLGLARGASSDAQVIRESESEWSSYQLDAYLLYDGYIYKLHFTVDA
jgi:hypothetical protein